MNILLANLTYLPHLGGIENSFRHISEIYQKQGHNVIIVCSNVKPGNRGKLEQNETINGVKVYRYNRFSPIFDFLKPFVNLTDIIQSYLLVRKLDLIYDFDFSIVRNMKVGVGARLALKAKPVIYVLSSITKFLDYKKLNEFKGHYISNLIRWFYHNKITLGQDVYFEKVLLRISSLNVVFSKNMINQVNELLKIDSNKIKLITPGVDSNRFVKKENIVVGELESQIKSADFVFLLLGRLINVKGVDVAIKAFRDLKYSSAKFVIVGNGPELDYLKTMVGQMSLEEKVIFISKTSVPEDYFAISDAFLMTSSYESFGQTILEAMSSELPVIGFKSNDRNIRTATSEIIKNSENGFLCGNSVLELTETMQKIIDLTHSERQAIGRNNRLTIKNNYTWQQFANSILDLEIIDSSK